MHTQRSSRTEERGSVAARRKCVATTRNFPVNQPSRHKCAVFSRQPAMHVRSLLRAHPVVGVTLGTLAVSSVSAVAPCLCCWISGALISPVGCVFIVITCCTSSAVVVASFFEITAYALADDMTTAALAFLWTDLTHRPTWLYRRKIQRTGLDESRLARLAAVVLFNNLVIYVPSCLHRRQSLVSFILHDVAHLLQSGD